ncbi:phosphoribosylanthranilate isomerase [Psychrobacter sp. I-STPA6b]|uniref:phosphoribosylanthranilate isomerase n=1 Tax=Psychrobacter sp. I-STPA6b TaxID=2585718 RepID=UPI001D0C989E|nr:phosphoribosylanthranilate isomerase [Psychrobacter sp. I-STPA6b]
MIQVKFCGLTARQDIKKAVSLGVDAIGLVFYPPSPRAVSIEQAVELVNNIPAFVTVVALVVNMSADELQNLAQQVAFDVIQFHGDESAKDCQELAKLVNKRWIKALRINAQKDSVDSILQQITEFAQAGASSILLDAYHKNAYGGMGERFDWSLIPNNSPLPIILAGGLTPENVGQTLDLPIIAVDVSGGIEASKGIKDAEKMQAFIQAVSSQQDSP